MKKENQKAKTPNEYASEIAEKWLEDPTREHIYHFKNPGECNQIRMSLYRLKREEKIDIEKREQSLKEALSLAKEKNTPQDVYGLTEQLENLSPLFEEMEISVKLPNGETPSPKKKNIKDATFLIIRSKRKNIEMQEISVEAALEMWKREERNPNNVR